jgi:uncharacterized protein with HEPN domain
VSRDYVQTLSDMLEACDRIASYLSDTDGGSLAKDRKTLDAVVRNLQVLGEAAKRVPETIRAQAPGIAWRKITGMRDVLIHDYFGVDDEVVWDAALMEVPRLRDELVHLLSALPASP